MAKHIIYECDTCGLEQDEDKIHAYKKNGIITQENLSIYDKHICYDCLENIYSYFRDEFIDED